MLLCSAGSAVPWLQLTQRDITLAVNASQDITLTFTSDAMTAGTYRAQLCLFADYNYGKDLCKAVASSFLFKRSLAVRYAGTLLGCDLI